MMNFKRDAMLTMISMTEDLNKESEGKVCMQRMTGRRTKGAVSTTDSHYVQLSFALMNP